MTFPDAIGSFHGACHVLDGNMGVHSVLIKQIGAIRAGPCFRRVLIARDRDVADVAISTTFGPNTLEGFRVRIDDVTGSRALAQS